MSERLACQGVVGTQYSPLSFLSEVCLSVCQPLSKDIGVVRTCRSFAGHGRLQESSFAVSAAHSVG